MKRARPDAGFALAALICFLTAAAVATAVVLPLRVMQTRRQTEEELIFRGFLQPLLVRSLGAPAGILATALPFGLLHFQEYGNSWRHVLLISLSGVAFGLNGADAKRNDPFLVGKLPTLLPEGVYRFETEAPDPTLATLAWLLGSYSFNRYRKRSEKSVRLVTPKGVDAEEVSHIANAVVASRDLVNTPTSDLGPDGIEAAARELAERHGASFTSIVGDDLLKQNFPMIHAVGRASATPPRLIDFTWGKADAPRVTLVGKGVAFDTGGLDIKPASSMLLMRKDMGGAAATLALASMIMDAKLPVRLRVLIPAVENSISSNAFRPGDVIVLIVGDAKTRAQRRAEIFTQRVLVQRPVGSNLATAAISPVCL